MKTTTSKELYDILTKKKSKHGYGISNWLRENRRRRSAGLPQKRILKLTGDITRTMRDGVQEIFHV